MSSIKLIVYRVVPLSVGGRLKIGEFPFPVGMPHNGAYNFPDSRRSLLFIFRLVANGSLLFHQLVQDAVDLLLGEPEATFSGGRCVGFRRSFALKEVEFAAGFQCYFICTVIIACASRSLLRMTCQSLQFIP